MPVEISNKFNQPLSRKAVDITNDQDEYDYYKLIDLISELGTGEKANSYEDLWY